MSLFLLYHTKFQSCKNWIELWRQIKPISGPDGKPTAVDHVLELVENHAANIKGLQPESGSDSDDWIDGHFTCPYWLKEFHLS